MDFFERQEKAHRNTRRLVLLFLLAVVGVVAAVNLAVLAIFFGVEAKTGYEVAGGDARSLAALWVTAATLAVMGTGTGYKMLALSRGGEAVAQLLGGRPLDPNTQAPAERRLLNVVEEMALAAGTPVPTVYLLDKESSINAFAAGHSPTDAVVAVTQGTLELLDRDELQGVVGHEFSHILNGDMRLNLRLMGLLHGVLVIGLIGYWILRSTRFSGGSRKKDGNAFGLLGLALFVTGYVGLFFGKLIKSAVSRQREFLADASSVQFTRNPQGLASALKKIGGLADGSRIRDPHAEQASHLFFGNGLSKAPFAWMSTHPPLEDRIRRLDPSFAGIFPKVRRPAAADRVAASPTPAAGPDERVNEFMRRIATVGAVVAAGAGGRAKAAIGTPTREHLDYAAELISVLPAELRTRAQEPAGARALVLGLLIDLDDAAVRATQLDELRDDAALATEVESLLPRLEECPLGVRLPLLDLAIPALRRLSSEQYADLEGRVNALSAADGRTSLFEFTLSRLLLRHLAPTFGRADRADVQYYGLSRLGAECSTLLSAVAWAGAADAGAAAAALGRGAARLGHGLQGLDLRDADSADLEALGAALTTLERVAPRLKGDLIDACSETVAADGMVTLAEAELLRAIADSLGCPVPPILPGSTA
jgi:Zn-dependent protease with chaperone function